MDWRIVTTSPDETRNLGALLGQKARPGTVVLLNGDLGSGKTCFAQGVARGLGVPEVEPVTSPSYTLMNIYQGRRMALYHFDLYRLAGAEDLEDLGYEEFAGQDGLALVEWADRVPGLPLSTLKVRIEVVGPEERKIYFQSTDSAGLELLRSLRGKAEPIAE